MSRFHIILPHEPQSFTPTLQSIPAPSRSKKATTTKEIKLKRVHFNNSKQRATSTAVSSSVKVNPIIQVQNTDTYDIYKKNQRTWVLMNRLNQDIKFDDPLRYADERLSSFFETYNFILNLMNTERRNSITKSLPLIKQAHSDIELNEFVDLIGHWSLCALKMITGVDQFVTKRALQEYSNFELKGKEKMKVFNVQEEFFGQQWSWQLAIDNPEAEIYDFTFRKKLETNLPSVGPKNISTIHVDTISTIDYVDNYFSMGICYDLWLHLKCTDWVPALTEIYRVLKPNAYIHLFLYDFDILDCSNKQYSDFFTLIQKILSNLGIDPWPSKHIHQRLKDAGFQEINYSYIALRKGIPNNMGYLLDFLQSYFELIIFDKIANFHMSNEDLENFKTVKTIYHEAVKSKKFLTEFGSGYCMSVFAKKLVS